MHFPSVVDGLFLAHTRRRARGPDGVPVHFDGINTLTSHNPSISSVSASATRRPSRPPREMHLVWVFVKYHWPETPSSCETLGRASRVLMGVPGPGNSIHLGTMAASAGADKVLAAPGTYL